MPFTGSVKLRALLLKAGPGEKTPAKVSLVCEAVDYAGVRPNARLQFANENTIDFEDIVNRAPTQEFDIPQGREVGEYQVRYFSHKVFHSNRVSRVLQGCKIHEYFLHNGLFPSLTRGRRNSHILSRISGSMERGECGTAVGDRGGITMVICAIVIEKGGPDYHCV